MPVLLLFGFFTTVAVVGVLWRSRVWLRGRSDPHYPSLFSLLRGFVAFPRRYLVDVHHVVARRPIAARMHAMGAGGFLGSVPAAIAVHMGLHGLPSVMILLSFLCICMIGAILDILRRAAEKRRLAGGGYAQMPYLLIAYSVFHAVAILPELQISSLSSWKSPFGLAVLAFGIAVHAMLFVGCFQGPFRHAVLGALHVSLHTRPDRFDSKASVGSLLPQREASYGVADPTEFTWTQLLSFDACVQCGRCEEVCPANAAGQPLNPRGLIVGLAQQSGALVTYEGNDPGPLILTQGSVILANDTLWSCTTCGACVQACPMLIEHVDAITDVRRSVIQTSAQAPRELTRAIENTRDRGNTTAQDPNKRWNWVEEMGVPVLPVGGKTDVLLWLGDHAFNPRHRRVLRRLIEMMAEAGVDFGILGEDEWDCGDWACRAGDEATFQELARANIEALSARRFNRIVAPDPHAVHALKNEYRRCGGAFDCIHHSQLLSELVDNGRLKPNQDTMGRITYHDPCYLARYIGETDAPRAVVEKSSRELVDPPRTQEATFCCGAGGGAALSDIAGEARVPDIRMAELASTGADCVAVSCPNCAVMLEGVTGDGPQVRDIAEILWEATRPS